MISMMIRSFHKLLLSHRLSASGLLLAAMLVGCGSNDRPLAPVSGQVLYNGEPLTFGSVTFQPAGGQPARADIGPDGKFELQTPGEGAGGVVGRNRIRVTSFEGQAPTAAATGDAPLGKSLIPERYTSYTTSGLEVEIQQSNNEPIIIELTD